MNRDADSFIDVQWVAQCARRLREQWPRATLDQVDDTALELWQDESLRTMSAEQAMDLWLRPLRRQLS